MSKEKIPHTYMYNPTYIIDVSNRYLIKNLCIFMYTRIVIIDYNYLRRLGD